MWSIRVSLPGPRAGWPEETPPAEGGPSSGFGEGALESLRPSLAGLNIQDLSKDHGGGSHGSLGDPQLGSESVGRSGSFFTDMYMYLGEKRK